MKKYLLTLFVLAVGSILLFSCSDTQFRTNKIKKGDLTVSITETGELAAVNTKAFVLPRYGYWYKMKIIGLVDHGTRVQAGDSIIQFDPSEVVKFIIDKETSLEQYEANLNKLIVSQASQNEEYESMLESEQAAFNLKKLEMEYAKFETEKNKKIKELEFEQAKITLQKAKRNIELNKIVAANDLKIAKLSVQQIKTEIQSAQAVLDKLTIQTAIPGIFQISRNRRTDSKIKVGDEVYYGTTIGSVPDLTWMKVKTIVNETDFLKMKIGQKVNVRLDALPNVVFNGEISFISKLCHKVNSKTRQKVFDVEVKLLVSDERLKPGMTVSCEYICDELHDVFYAPLSCINTIDNESFIYLAKGGSYKKMKVELGAKNNVNAEIKGDFKNGAKISTGKRSRINRIKNRTIAHALLEVPVGGI